MRSQVQYRLLIVRLGAMGDILHALPAVTALRKAHPEWRIGWAVEPRWRPLLTAEPVSEPAAGGDRERGRDHSANNSGNHAGEQTSERSMARPLVDMIHPVANKDWGRRPLSRETQQGVKELWTELRMGEYDAVLDLQGAIRSAVVARLSGCRRVIGEASPREGVAKWLFTERVRTRGLHVIEQDLELAGAVVGDLLEPTLPWLPVDSAAEAWCDQLEGLRVAAKATRPIVLIHPGAGWGAKRWPSERYGAVAAEFARRGALVLVNAGPGEEALAAEVAAGQGRAVVALKTSLAQLIALTRRISLAIGGDTGPLHLACALGKPVVGIYGPTDPARNGPYGARFRVLRNPESRTDHSRREPTEAGLLTILPETVMAATVELLLEEREARMREGKVRVESPGERWGKGPIWEARR